MRTGDCCGWFQRHTINWGILHIFMATLPPARLVQFNPLVGDIDGNRARIQAWLETQEEPSIWVFPELALCGYPPEDLLLRDDFIDQVAFSLEELAHQVGEHWMIVGAPVRENGALYNAACVLHQGRQVGFAYKKLLPHYDVFDEQRYFVPGSKPFVIEAGQRLGLLICEDLWQPEPAADLAAAGAEVLVCLNASPFDLRKASKRLEVARARALETGCPVWYVNQVGGQDELVFDGASFVLDASGQRIAQLPSFVEAELELTPEDSGWTSSRQDVEDLDEDATLYQALVLGVRDYVDKHRTPGALVGLSGGIDSALTLVIAADALGVERLEAVLMPSRYTSEASIEDAVLLCERLGVSFLNLSIEPAFQSMLETLGPEAEQDDLVCQNLQARIRGLLLMACSNHSGKLLLTTGNKSEMAVGYATLYGDMAGGFAPLKDIFKTRVYQLARHRNRDQEIIPERTLTRPPSAELKPDQKDSDSLPDYAVLDAVLRLFIEEDRSPSEIVAQGFDSDLVHDVVARVLKSEYKRRQAPPGVKTTERAFGRDRRYPITSGYKA